MIWANDESFAEKENLINPGPASYRPASFGHKGQVYDGWETRRRREPGHDQAIVRLGVPGVIRGVVVDTAWFKGNYPPEVSIEALAVDGYPPAEQLASDGGWETIVARAKVVGDADNPFVVSSEKRWTHVRLSIYPDGGVARLRVHGEGRPDRRFLGAGPLDLAALENGGLVLDCSNRFYSSPQHVIFPGLARVMGDGWETARRRDDGNDWVLIKLAGPAWCGWSKSTRRISSGIVRARRRWLVGSPLANGSSCYRAPTSCPTPGTGFWSAPKMLWIRLVWRSIRMAGYRGCGCSGTWRDRVSAGYDRVWSHAARSPVARRCADRGAIRAELRRGGRKQRPRRRLGVRDLLVRDRARTVISEPAHEHGVALRIRISGGRVAGAAGLRAIRRAADHFRRRPGDAAKPRGGKGFS
ncbi:allantoicase [Mycobacterium ulcerans str. Harvey]|uniref:Allantoicase n=1 Tax=Mycobacterium ulcerans str. Harvey TaxID=1299332 RepID=A0ABN0QXB7_MYCUL|nr:allantoicase [Mycobacterium ulcerans str. Harvey]